MRALVTTIAVIAPLITQAQTELQYESSAGDYIGQGETNTLTPAAEDVSINTFTDRVIITSSADPSWSVDLGAIAGDGFEQACYERAQRSAFRDIGRPGIDFSLNSRGCNETAGRFKIHEIQFDQTTGDLISLAADFVQQCNENGGAWLVGRLRHNSNVSFDTPDLRPTISLTGNLSFTSGTEDFIGQGESRSFVIDTSSAVAERNFDNGISLNFDGLDGQSVDSIWDFDLAAPDEAELTTGSYVDAQRFPFQDPGNPGLSYTLDGRGCNEVSGEFHVASVGFDELDGLPTTLDASFEQYCDTGEAPLNGDVQFVAEIIGEPYPEGVIFASNFEATQQYGLVRNCSN